MGTNRRSLLQYDAFYGEGEYVGYAINNDLFINCYPKTQTLTGDNLSTALDVTIPTTDPAALQMTEELIANGYAIVGVRGNFGLRVGTLELVLDYFQAISIPTCDLNYVQSHKLGGICSSPPTQNITG
jgi:hypothetical protein